MSEIKKHFLIWLMCGILGASWLYGSNSRPIYLHQAALLIAGGPFTLATVFIVGSSTCVARCENESH